MRYLVLSDIHANLEALEAVLADPPAATADRVLALGDLVGYGADPNAVVERMRALEPAAIVRGNHDKVVTRLEDPEAFNDLARTAAKWTADELTDDNLAYLRGLPAGPASVPPLIEICHGAPYDEDAYIVSDRQALRALRSAGHPICLFGHTHVPVIVRLEAGRRPHAFGRVPQPAGEVRLDAGGCYLINPGSVGQPRDDDPRAAYAVVDDTHLTVELRRVAYPVESAQQKIHDAGLPALLAHRLGIGR